MLGHGEVAALRCAEHLGSRRAPAGLPIRAASSGLRSGLRALPCLVTVGVLTIQPVWAMSGTRRTPFARRPPQALPEGKEGQAVGRIPMALARFEPTESDGRHFFGFQNVAQHAAPGVAPRDAAVTPISIVVIRGGPLRVRELGGPELVWSPSQTREQRSIERREGNPADEAAADQSGGNLADLLRAADLLEARIEGKPGADPELKGVVAAHVRLQRKVSVPAWALEPRRFSAFASRLLALAQRAEAMEPVRFVDEPAFAHAVGHATRCFEARLELGDAPPGPTPQDIASCQTLSDLRRLGLMSVDSHFDEKHAATPDARGGPAMIDLLAADKRTNLDHGSDPLRNSVAIKLIPEGKGYRFELAGVPVRGS